MRQRRAWQSCSEAWQTSQCASSSWRRGWLGWSRRYRAAGEAWQACLGELALLQGLLQGLL